MVLVGRPILKALAIRARAVRNGVLRVFTYALRPSSKRSASGLFEDLDLPCSTGTFCFAQAGSRWASGRHSRRARTAETRAALLERTRLFLAGLAALIAEDLLSKDHSRDPQAPSEVNEEEKDDD